jgi:hypothetical protein
MRSPFAAVVEAFIPEPLGRPAVRSAIAVADRVPG